MINIFRSKLPFLRKNFSLFQQSLKYNADVSSSPKDSSITTNMRMTNEFKLRPEDIDDYIVIGSEIFKNAFKESVILSEKETDAAKRIEMIVNEIEKKPEVYGTMTYDFKIPEVKESIKVYMERPFLDHADISQRHLFVPSWRDKNESLNALLLYKFSYIGGSRKNHNEAIFKRVSYIKEMMPPFKLNDENLENCFTELDNWIKENKVEDVNEHYEKNKELDRITKKIYDCIPYVNHSVYGNLLMKIFFEFNLNHKGIMMYLEQEILNNLHHLSVEDICKIHFVAKILSPKYTSLTFTRTLVNTIQEKLPELTINQLYCVLFGFRMHKDKSFFDKIVNIFIDKKNQLLKKNIKDLPANLARMFYSYASSKPRHYGILTFYPHKEIIEKLIMAYDNELLENILKMDQYDLCRLTHALYLLKSDSVDLYINRIERNLLKQKDNLEPYVVATVMKAFSKMKDNTVCGSDKFFAEMEPFVLKNLNNFSHDDFLNIVYSYYIRRQTSKQFEEEVLKKIKNDIHQYNTYSMLYTLTYYLLFTESTDKFLWQTMMDNFNKIKGGKVPITYYRPFKIALFYLNKKFPNFREEFDFFDFQDKFYGAEQYYNYIRNEKYFEADHRNFHFKSMLSVRHTIFPVPYVVYENLFIVHFTVEHKKIGFNLFFEKETVWKSNPIRINKMAQLHSQMMKLLDWEILDLTWEQYIGIGNQEARDKYIQTWYNGACERQKAKGIIKPPKNYV